MSSSDFLNITSKQLEDLSKRYNRLDNLEDKVSNVKERIFLMNKHLNPKPDNKVIDISKPLPKVKERSVQDIEYDLMEMKKKLLPKDPFQEIAEEADNDLDRALKKALEKHTK